MRVAAADTAGMSRRYNPCGQADDPMSARLGWLVSVVSRHEREALGSGGSATPLPPGP